MEDERYQNLLDRYEKLRDKYHKLEDENRHLENDLSHANYQIRTELEPRIRREKNTYDNYVTGGN